ncbi:MAG: transcription termination factor Rho [Microthrixaceae bacterium]
MADDSIDLERSKLEGKDRAQLVTIATALGSKPPARAKKADIIDLILRLAGVEEAGAAEATPDQATKAGRPAQRGAGAADSDPGNGSSAGADHPTSGDQDGGQHDGQGPNGKSEASDGDGQDGGQVGSARNGEAEGEGEEDEGNRRRRGRRRGRNRDDDDSQWEGEPVEVAGFLDLRDEGYGFLRVKGYLPSREDVYISAKMVRQNGLRKGDHVTGAYRPAGGREKNPALLRVDKVMDLDPEQARQRPRFDELVPVHPHERINLTEAAPEDATVRAIDVLAPIGLGQRGLIVAPARTGATTVLSRLAQAIEAARPEAHVILLLIDERPEEVTGLGELTNGEVIASGFDRPPDEHTHVVELTLERAKRLVELGKDVVILLDGVTRLVRAYSAAGQPTGRTLPGGIDATALFPPKRFLGAARSLRDNGSLTILATLRSDTASPADELVWAEFAGTANMEVHLNRLAAQWQVFPALDVEHTATRHEDLLVDDDTAEAMVALRRHLTSLNEGGSSLAGLEWLVEQVAATPDNAALLARVAKG